jgi:hypothetical protein
MFLGVAMSSVCSLFFIYSVPVFSDLVNSKSGFCGKKLAQQVKYQYRP